MNKRRILRFLWLIAGIAGLAFLFLGLLTDVAAGRYAARIAKHVSELEASVPDFVPTAEQYRQLSVAANNLSHLFGNHVLTQLFFVLPVTVLSFITFGILSKKPNGQGPAQQPSPRDSSKAADGLTGTRDS